MDRDYRLVEAYDDVLANVTGAKKNPLPFIRRQLGARGASQHTGRGSYHCSVHLTTGELFRRVSEKLPKWREKKYIQREDDTEDWIDIVLSKDKFQGDYRGFRFFKKQAGEVHLIKPFFVCFMVFDNFSTGE